MSFVRVLFLFFVLVLISCRGINGGKQSLPEKKLPNAVSVAVKEKTGVPEISRENKIIYDESDPDWQNKKMVDDLLHQLGDQDYQKRELSQKKLLELILDSEPEILDYFIVRRLKQDDPEISFRSKKVLESFFFKTVYDPDRKKGFIGLQLMEPGPMLINKQQHHPIRVVMPQDGFPGKKAGIKQGDLILGVDGKICSEDFTMNDFIFYIASLKPGTEINLAIFSMGKVKPVKVKLAARPESAHSLGPKKSKKQLFDTWYKKKFSEIKVDE